MEALEVHDVEARWKCAVCNQPDQDNRILRLQCLYNLPEVSDKFIKEVAIVRKADGSEAREIFWKIRVCKNCRGVFLGILRLWASGGILINTETHPERNIPVRLEGTTVMITREEWQANTSRDGLQGREPIVLKD